MPLQAKTVRRYNGIHEKIRALPNSILAVELDVTLELYWCPRNMTPQLKKADLQAGVARKTRKCLYERNCGGVIDGMVRDCIRPNTRSGLVTGSAVVMEETSRGSHGREGDQAPQSRRRKLPIGEGLDTSVAQPVPDPAMIAGDTPLKAMAETENTAGRYRWCLAM